MTSLRRRVLVGAALWTLGLVAVLGISFPWFLPHGRPIRVVRLLHSTGFALHSVLLLSIAFACMIAGLAVVRRAFAPFDALRRRLAVVRTGAERRIDGAYPGEVQPLVDDLNALLAHTDRAVTRATARAGDLAHGLKTPLAVLGNEAGRLRARGDRDLADTLDQQLALMNRRVEWHLAQARASASGTAVRAQCSVAECAEGLRRALGRLHADRSLSVDLRIAPDHVFAGRREDLDEMLGNLLENACRWAASTVVVSSQTGGDVLTVTVDDDGSGLAPELRERVLQRGVRADEAAGGSGLGLAIVRELAELYGGSITLEAAPAGGLRAKLALPASAPGAPGA